MAFDWTDAVEDLMGNAHEGYLAFMGVPQAEAQAHTAEAQAYTASAQAQAQAAEAQAAASAASDQAKVVGGVVIAGLIIWAVASRK